MKRRKQWPDNLIEQRELGRGGNAVVFLIRDKYTGEDWALKQLIHKNGKKAISRFDKEKQERFLNEINVAVKYAKRIPGILPIKQFNKEDFWYIMPRADLIDDHIQEKPLQYIIKGIIQLSETLIKLHEKGVAHRDIKPANIYFYKDRFCLGDFGLVDFPENTKDLTKSNRSMGPIFTMAPEMKRNPKKADGKKADVYSLAKTMWILLTGNGKGFDGAYSYTDPTIGLHFSKKLSGKHLVEIEELLKKATENNPDKRPSMKEFKQSLEDWSMVFDDVDKAQISDWNFLRKQIFGEHIPRSAAWNDRESIVGILNYIAMSSAYNHMLFSDSGGLDLLRATSAAEVNCICIENTGGYHFIVKPKYLYFESFWKADEWNYFLLELDKLEPVLPNSAVSYTEFLVEDSPGHYVDGRYVQYGVYDYDSGKPLPKGYRTVERYLTGKFLIVMKNGPYNKIPGTYDGRHGDCESIVFRSYMESIKNMFHKLREQLHTKMLKSQANVSFDEDELNMRILNTELFNKNPFKTEQAVGGSKGSRFTGADTKELNEYIKKSITTWDFKELLTGVEKNETTKIKFYYVFSNESYSLLSDMHEKDKFLCKDGRFRVVDYSDIEPRFYITDRAQATVFKDKLEERIDQILKEKGFSYFSSSKYDLTIKLMKCGKPEHLFTRREIEIALRNADDRVSNQLVIDEDGYAKIIQKLEMAPLYPVSMESWDAGNVYVGKYAKNIPKIAEDSYMLILEGWLDYLTTGRRQYKDYFSGVDDENTLLNKLKKLY